MGKCRFCGQWIGWEVREDGRSVPVSRNGENHFRTCPGWRDAKAEKAKKEKGRRLALKARREEKMEARQLTLF